MKSFSEEDEVKKESELKQIRPMRDFVIHHNEYHYDLKKGKSIEVHKKFLDNLKIEKVIK